MTTIADLSRYDPLEAVDLYDGVILNIEDPGFIQKRDRAIANSKPWGTYSWVYPGQGAAASERAFTTGTGPLGAWLDYEQNGLNGNDLTAALRRGEELGLKLGVYTYLYIIGSVATLLGDHPLWLAYYPGNNDGTYPAGNAGDAVAHGALLWQYTSSNGTRDLSHVLDDTKWTAWTGGATPTPAPAPDDAPKDDVMIAVTQTDGYFVKAKQFWLVVPGTYAVQVGQGQTLEQVIGNWGGLPRVAVPGSWVDGWIVAVLQTNKRNAALDKYLAAHK